jgi:hypothetical protein
MSNQNSNVRMLKRFVVTLHAHPHGKDTITKPDYRRRLVERYRALLYGMREGMHNESGSRIPFLLVTNPWRIRPFDDGEDGSSILL